MTVAVKPLYRAILIGIAAAGLLIGAFLLGSGGQPAAATGATADRGGSGGFTLTASPAGGKITVTGTGTVTGTPDQLVLSMGVQTNASSVSIALRQANEAASRVIRSLKAGGVRAADIQTSGLSIQPNYSNGSQVPVGYGVGEQLTATLRNLAKAGSQIQAAATAGGNATTVSGVSLNLADTGGCWPGRAPQLSATRRPRPASSRAAWADRLARCSACPTKARCSRTPSSTLRREPRLRAHRSRFRLARSRSASRSRSSTRSAKRQLADTCAPTDTERPRGGSTDARAPTGTERPRGGSPDARSDKP